MSTPMETMSWKLFAWKKGSAIYLKGKSEDRVRDAASEVEKTCESFLKMAFQRTLTQTTASSCHMNEADMFLKISVIQFGQHNLISMSEGSARDVYDNEVRIFLKKEITEKDHKICFYNGKYFSLWAEAQITNQSHIIIGKYGDQMTVKSIAAVPATTSNMMSVMQTEMAQHNITDRVWDPDHACSFLNRFLIFVRKTLFDAADLLDDERLVSFEYVKKTTKVIIPVIVSTTAPFDFE